ncbi:hypothetical protein CFD26_104810 [Aspergillus turcosus]|uniref:Major facilitator superfamily (MFS) profile domain-containing protein n=1 Tax=Aspergillus turcosus TaxID=1245748 RepID=A0A3R7F6W1_9EURO|nr:hypothetical protein CFD26_104810 [Aspergillus turcosus]
MTTSQEKPLGDTTIDNAKDKDKDKDDIVYPTGLKLSLLMISIFISMFLVSLDRLIISTAIPQITDEFHSAGDIGWYGTAYLLTNCAFQLLFGKIYTIFRIKATFMTSILLFEVGSALCGAAPNSIGFIVGRAIAGLGSGGILSGIMTIIVFALPLHKRPKYQGFFGAVFGVASVAGPLVGGAFTTNVTWRWCFYVNLPLGGVVMVVILLLLEIPNRPNSQKPLKEKLRQLNGVGILAILPGIVCLCLALQWGGTKYAWSEGRIVALLVLAIILLIAFVLIQASCCLGAHTILFVYYLPIWFQVIDGVSAVQSGIRLLPMLLPLVVASILTGKLVSRIGYYTPFLILGICLSSIGAGLLTTLGVHTPKSKWIGFQVLYGFGLGTCNQIPNMAAQTVLPREQVAIGASFMFFGQQLFGAVFTSVGQNVLSNQLAKRLAISPQIVQNSGATQLLDHVPVEDRAASLGAYNDSLRVCFQVGLVMACLAIVGGVAMEWRSVKKKQLPLKPETDGQAEEDCTIEQHQGDEEIEDIRLGVENTRK